MISKIPINLRNPGHVFACMGLFELAEGLLGDTTAYFDWEQEQSVNATFALSAEGVDDPIRAVLEALMTCKVKAWSAGHVFPCPPKVPGSKKDMTAPHELVLEGSRGEVVFTLTSWADGSSRGSFKLFAGQQSATGILRGIVEGDPKKGRFGIRDVLRTTLNSSPPLDPFGPVVPTGPTFRIDPRSTWESLGAGYSLNDVSAVRSTANPVVALLAVVGLEHARPRSVNVRAYRYGAWSWRAPLQLARAVVSGCEGFPETRLFEFRLEDSGKNKNVCFAEEVTAR